MKKVFLKAPDGAYFLFVAFLLLYSSTLCPTVWWGDSGEFIAQAYTLGISHPPGHALYGILGKLFTLFPFGNIAQRVNFLSAFSASGSIALLYLIILRTTQTPLSAWLVSIGLGISSVFWGYATIAEVYSLKWLTFLLLLYLTLQPQHSFSSLSFLAYLFGLATGVHTTILLYLPGFIIYFVLLPGKRIALKKLFLVGLFFILGSLINLYLPLRSSQNPPVDWGNTQNFKNFILHLAGYEAYHLFSKGTFFTNLKFLVQSSFSQFNLLLLLFPIGIYSLFYKKKLLFIFTSVVFLTNSLFYLSSAAQAPQFYLISFVMISIWLGEGLTVIFNKLKKLLLKYLFLGVIVFLLGSIFFKNFDLNNRRGNISAYLYGRELLKRANQNAIIVTRNSVIYFLTQYFQKVENFRRDVKVIFENILRFPWYLESLVKKEKALPPECLKIAQRISESREKGSVSKLMNQLFTLSLSRLPLYLPYFDYFFWEEKLKEKGLVCIPEGLLLRVRKTIPEEFPEIVVHPIPYDKYSQPFWSDTYQVFGDIYYNLGNQCLRHRYFQKALSLYQRSLALVPGKGDIYNNIGVCYAQLNSLPKALFYFKKAHFFNPNLREPYFNLAKIYLRLKDFNKASFWARKGLKIIPESASLKGILHQSEKGN